jgi:hypothetical protein
MPRGARTGERRGGRAKGAKNKHPSTFRTGLRQYCEALGVDPHRFMAEMLADTAEIVYGVDSHGAPIVGPAVKKDLKLQAAKELAQYLEPKLKATEHSGELQHTIRSIKVTLE